MNGAVSGEGSRQDARRKRSMSEYETANLAYKYKAK